MTRGEEEQRPRIVVIAGPTASGKSALAVLLARGLDAEIVSADSMQVYRFMDIGTAKPPESERLGVPHHLIDVVCPDEQYTAARFRTEAIEAIEDITTRGKRVIVVGGTGLYIRALTRGLFKGPGRVPELRRELMEEAGRAGQAGESGPATLYKELLRVDPEAARKIHPNNVQRVIRALEVYRSTGRPMSGFQKEHAFKDALFDCLKIGLKRPKDELGSAIDLRVDRMVEGGLLEETRGLIEKGYTGDLKPMQGLGYKEMVRHLSSKSRAGGYPLDEAVRDMKMNTRRYAKRQMTWFNAEKDISWFSPDEREGITRAVGAHFDDGRGRVGGGGEKIAGGR